MFTIANLGVTGRLGHSLTSTIGIEWMIFIFRSTRPSGQLPPVQGDDEGFEALVIAGVCRPLTPPA